MDSHVYMCVLLCFIKPILGNRYVRSRGFIVSEPRETHPRSEIADVPTLPCPPLDNLGCLDPHPPPQLRRWLHRSPPLPLRTDPATTTLTTRGLCPGGSVVWVGPKFVRPHWWRSWVMIRFLEIQSPNCRETLHRPLPKATLVCKKKKNQRRRRTCPKAPSLSHSHYGNITELIAADQFVTSLDSSGSVSLQTRTPWLRI